MSYSPNKQSSSNEVGLVKMITQRSIEKERSSCWKHNFSSQFPIVSMTESDGMYIMHVGSPHEGYSIETHLMNNKMHGKSSVYSNKYQKVAELNFEDGKVQGPCTLYDTDGILFFKGFFKNGYRSGKGKEYDTEGKVIFDGYFHLGKRIIINPLQEISGFWKEYDESGKLLNICKRNEETGEKEGICYYYDENGQISHIVEVKEGEEIEYSGYCTLYDEPHKVWYEGIVENGIRHGEGKEFDASGTAVIYQGFWIEGQRQEGSVFDQNGEMDDEGEWIGDDEEKENKTINWWAVVLCMVVIGALIMFFYVLQEGLGIFVTLLLLHGMLLYMKFWFGKIRRRLDYLMADMLLRPNLVFADKCFCSTKEFNPPIHAESIEIGDDSFKKVQTFVINELNQLGNLFICENSFTEKKNDYDKNESKSFHILNCESLHYIRIYEYSFSDFAGDFELKNLPQLRSIHIGTIGKKSYNFSYSSFVIRGIDMILNV